MTEQDYKLAEQWVENKLSPENRNELQARMDADAQFKKDFEETVQMIEDLHLLRRSHLPDGYADNLNQLEDQLAQNDLPTASTASIRKLIPWIAAAAAVIIAVVFLMPGEPVVDPGVITGPAFNTNYIVLDTAVFKNPEIKTHPKTHLTLHDYREIQKGIDAFNAKNIDDAKAILKPYHGALPLDTAYQSFMLHLEVAENGE